MEGNCACEQKLWSCRKGHNDALRLFFHLNADFKDLNQTPDHRWTLSAWIAGFKNGDAVPGACEAKYMLHNND
eukprot:2000812-Karenia_brevis.AAC.1